MAGIDVQMHRALKLFNSSGRKPGGVRGHAAIMIIWGMYKGQGPGTMAKTFNMKRLTVHNMRAKFIADPGLIFNHPVLTKFQRAKKAVWRCEFCGHVLAVKERVAREHTALHVFTQEQIALGGVGLDRVE